MCQATGVVGGLPTVLSKARGVSFEESPLGQRQAEWLPMILPTGHASEVQPLRISQNTKHLC